MARTFGGLVLALAVFALSLNRTALFSSGYPHAGRTNKATTVRLECLLGGGRPAHWPTSPPARRPVGKLAGRLVARPADGLAGLQVDKPWERKTVDESTCRWLNGETPKQMAHAEAIKKAGGVSLNPRDGTDTSKDAAWTYNKKKLADRFVLSTTFLWLAPKILLFALPMLICHLPPMFVARTFIALFPDGTEEVKRTRSFYVIFTIALVLSLPLSALVLVPLLLDNAMYYVFSILYCVCTCRWARARKSFEFIAPYRNGPSIVHHLPDFFLAIMGQCARQRVGETLYMVSCMWLLMPWLKYYINCNPFIYDLGHRFVQQISTSMEDVGNAQRLRIQHGGSFRAPDKPESKLLELTFGCLYPTTPTPPRIGVGPWGCKQEAVRILESLR